VPVIPFFRIQEEVFSKPTFLPKNPSMSIDKIGRYEIEGELGHGGMSSVYVARDPFMNRQVAIKVLSYKLVSDTMFHEHFQREAEVIASLEHPCVVPIFDFG
jgi:serine/threonine-protein kinase